MRKKPGPSAYKPTATQRRRVMRGIAVGLTMQQLADDLDVSISTVRRVFGAEIKTARVRLILDNLDRLHEAADHGNVSAMRELARMMQPRTGEPDDTEDDDDWADIVPNLNGNLEIQEMTKLEQRTRARTFRDLCIAARDGDHAAIRAMLRRHGWPQLADEVRRGKPIPPRVAKMVGAIVAPYGTPWETLLPPDPPSPRMARTPPVFEDDEDDAASRSHG